MTNKEKAKQIAKKYGIKYDTITKEGKIIEMDKQLECYRSAVEMAKWKDEQAQKLRAERMKANNLSNSIQTISNLLEWLYARYPNVYCECNTQIRYYQKELRDKLDKELNNEEK